MAATVTLYNNALKEMAQGTIRFDGNTAMKLLLVAPGSGYTFSKAHTIKTDFTATGTEASGSGYTPGGNVVTFVAGIASSVTIDSATNAINIAIPATSWSNSTVSAKAAILLTNTGNAATDKLVAYANFDATVSSSNSTFTVTFSTPIKLQN